MFLARQSFSSRRLPTGIAAPQLQLQQAKDMLSSLGLVTAPETVPLAVASFS
jgi:hypothetical protein